MRTPRRVLGELAPVPAPAGAAMDTHAALAAAALAAAALAAGALAASVAQSFLRRRMRNPHRRAQVAAELAGARPAAGASAVAGAGHTVTAATLASRITAAGAAAAGHRGAVVVAAAVEARVAAGEPGTARRIHRDAGDLLSHEQSLPYQADGSSQCNLLIAFGVMTRAHVVEARAFALRLWPADEEA